VFAVVIKEEDDMDIRNVVEELRREVTRIEKAIAALTALGSQPARRGRPPKVRQAETASGPKRRRVSAAARARIGAAKKAWWARQKGKTASKQAASKRKPMSPAMRKKLSAMMKARWVQRRKLKAAAQ
jgi:hypothetical protein